MTHNELWIGIRNLASEFNVSCSKLAKISGLDPTVFNRSKEYTNSGKPRWISICSLARIMDATGITLSEFAAFLPSDTHVLPKYQHFPPKKDNVR